MMENKLKKLNEEELLIIDSWDDEETLVENVGQKRKVKVQHKAKTSNLNQRKQFSDRISYCDRPLYRSVKATISASHWCYGGSRGDKGPKVWNLWERSSWREVQSWLEI